MAYGREQLRKAGKFATKADEGFSSGIVNMYMGTDENPRSYADNPMLGTAAGLAAIYLGGTPMSARGKKEAAPGAAYTSAAAKYGATTAGVTAAGMALIDLTSRFGSRADYPEEGQLPM